MVVSEALNTVMVARPNGLLMEESIIFPFKTPWENKKPAGIKADKSNIKRNFIVLVVVRGRIYTILFVDFSGVEVF